MQDELSVCEPEDFIRDESDMEEYCFSEDEEEHLQDGNFLIPDSSRLLKNIKCFKDHSFSKSNSTGIDNLQDV